MNQELFWIWLSTGLGAGARALELLTDFEWNPYEIFCASEEELLCTGALTRRKVEKLKSFPIEKAEELLRISKENGWEAVTPSDGCYPQLLVGLSDLPLVLYTAGDKNALAAEKTISVVGARNASDYGRAAARAVSSSLSDAGFTVVSGGALGIDSAAHRGALEAGGKTVCVLGCGLGTRYLAENERLRAEISGHGAVISEFPPFSDGTRYTFPLRNRIISGMSRATVVVEAGERSGSLVTARLAREQRRKVFAVPGDIVKSSFFGTNSLIRSGAAPVLSLGDILKEYGVESSLPDTEIIARARSFLGEADAPPEKSRPAEKKKTAAVKQPAPESLSEKARAAYECIGAEPIHVDDIKNKSGLTIQNTLSALTELEIYGLVAQMSGRRYKIK